MSVVFGMQRKDLIGATVKGVTAEIYDHRVVPEV